GSPNLPDRHSFPTRRSSDLELEAQGADIIGASLSSAGRYLQLSAHDLPASIAERGVNRERCVESDEIFYVDARGVRVCWLVPREDRKSTRLNSSHVKISYAV